jgi:hypothetical protein
MRLARLANSDYAKFTGAGEMLIEAKDQVAHGSWGRWLTTNCDLTSRTAQVYMEWARQMRGGASHLTSLVFRLVLLLGRRRGGL